MFDEYVCMFLHEHAKCDLLAVITPYFGGYRRAGSCLITMAPCRTHVVLLGEHQGMSDFNARTCYWDFVGACLAGFCRDASEAFDSRRSCPIWQRMPAQQ